MSSTSNILHLTKKAKIIIKKPKTMILDKYNALVGYVVQHSVAPTYEQWLDTLKDLKQREYARLSYAINTSKILVDNSLDPDYYYLVSEGKVTPKLDDTVKVVTRNSFDINSFSNDRLMSVTVTQNVSAAWTASVTLDNSGNYFNLHTFTSGYPGDVTFQENDCVIEANDIIQIYTNDWNNNYNIIFTGYVNSVTNDDDGLSKTIFLTCEDVTKKLSVSRTNASPSLNPLEAEAFDLSVYNQSWYNGDSNTIIKNILAREYCNIFDDPDFFASVEELLKQVVQLRTSDKSTQSTTDQTSPKVNALKAINSAIMKAINSDYTETINQSDGKPGRIIGYSGYYDKNAAGVRTFVRNKIAFIIEGIDQPCWALEINSGAYAFLISDWKSNDIIIEEICKRTFFEFFADESGVIHVRPTNLTLPKLNSEYASLNKIIQDNYWIIGDSSKYIKSYNTTLDDREIITDVYVQGQYESSTAIIEPLSRLIQSPYTYRRRYGVRMGPQETVIGKVEQKDLKSYGEQRIWRQNSTINKATVIFEGNSQLLPGNPIYLEHFHAVYYIHSITHIFTAGQDYTNTLNLYYRRRPIVAIPETVTSPTAYLKTKLNYLKSIQEISDDEYKYVTDNENALTWGLYTGDRANYIMVWSGIPSRLYVKDLQVRTEQVRNNLIDFKEASYNYLNDVAANKRSAETFLLDYSLTNALLKTKLKDIPSYNASDTNNTNIA